jgi:ComF family protein
MITQLKFSRRLSAAYGLGTLFARRLPDNGYTPSTLPEVVLPMPLHGTRLRQRGYNQAYELSRGLAPYIEINDQLCWRTKSTLAQSSLGKSARKVNMINAFSVSPHISAYKHVAIFDDVVTTGATVNALAGVLKEAGVEQVDIWCICRA